MKKLLATILALVMTLGLCTVSWADGEIEVSDSATLEEAIKNASESVEIKLVGSVEFSGKQLVIPEGKRVRLDLFGNELKITNYVTEKGQVKVVGELTVTDSSEANGGTISSTYTGTGGRVVDVVSGGKLILLNGTITAVGMNNAGSAVYVGGTGTAEMSGGKIIGQGVRTGTAVNVKSGNASFVMRGGYVGTTGDGTDSSIYAISGSSNSVIRVEGNSVVSAPTAVTARNSKIEIMGGDFTGAMTVKAKSISGGTFSNSVDSTYLADGLKYEVCAGGKYSYYSDFDSAAAAAAADGHEVIKVGNSGTGDVPFHIDYADGTGVKPALRMSKDNFELPTPTRSGYTFKGWKVLDCDGTRVLFAGPLSSEEVKSKIFAETAAGDEAEVRADYSDGVTLIAVWSSNSYYYYAPTTTDTKTDSPKTFDAGVGIYAVTALLSVTGMAWAGKKRH